ncbi:MAG: hypothetical protein LBU36_08350 [Clostridiales bacterium]|jgi:uncharacterized membrane protein (DUF485 family)|nr:hypothetical protein [Clostridiales bacterium]
MDNPEILADAVSDEELDDYEEDYEAEYADEEEALEKPVRPVFLRTFLSFAEKIADFIMGRKKTDRLEILSRFKIILENLEKSDPAYEVAETAAALCEEALKIARQRLSLAGKIASLDDKISEVKCFETLTPDETGRLQNLLNNYLSLSKERSALMYKITGFDSSLTRMTHLSKDAQKAMGNITEAEQQYRILKHDLTYIGGEKAELEYERDYLERGRDFIRKFSIGMVALFAAVTMLLGFLNVFEGVSIVFPMSVMVVLVVIILFLLYIFKRRMTYELKVNLQKQKRAVSLLNRKNAVYAHYINFLNYEYKKYKVKNSGMLRKNIDDYESYKRLTARIDSIRNIMYQTEEEIENFLRAKKINHLSTSVEHFAQTINVLDKQQYLKDLTAERHTLEKTLGELDNRHEEIWDLLIEMNEADTTDEKFINAMIDAYLDEIERVFSIIL